MCKFLIRVLNSSFILAKKQQFIYLQCIYLLFFPEWKAPYHIWGNPRLINSYCVLYCICFNMHCISHCNILHVITRGKLLLSWEYTEDVVMDDRMAARCMSSNYSVFASFLSLPTFWSLAVFLYKVYQRSLVARLSPVLPKLYFSSGSREKPWSKAAANMWPTNQWVR